MIRIWSESDQGWTLEDTVETLPADFEYKPAQMVEQDNGDGSVTILWQHQAEAEEPTIDNIESLKDPDDKSV